MNKWHLINTVWYDGEIAFVAKFIVNSTNQEEVEEEIFKLGYDGELLKIDFLYDLTFDEIMAMKDNDDNGLRLAFERFKDMYF